MRGRIRLSFELHRKKSAQGAGLPTARWLPFTGWDFGTSSWQL
jgi:hypothetical protein